MIQSAETRLDGNTLVVRIPMRFQRRGGRKRIVAPDGTELVPTSKPQPDGTLVKALARAYRWQRVLESGEYGTLAELSAAERISRSYICRVLRLTLLAPDIVERVMDGGADGWACAALGAVSGRVGEAARAVLNPVAGKPDGFIRLRKRLLPASAGIKCIECCCWRGSRVFQPMRRP